MNHTFSRKTLNHPSFELFQNTTKDPQPKKSNKSICNNRKQYKQAIITGINYPCPSNSIFSYYNNFSSLSKCHSSTKLIKTQNNSHISSKSFMSSTHDRKVSPSPQVISNINRNDKSLSSTMQSTDERKELNKLKAELKEKNDIIKSLNRTIEIYQRDRSQYNKEINSIKYQLLGYKKENSRLKKDLQALQHIYEGLNNEKNICSKVETNVDEDYRPEEQSLSGICFTDKVKMEKTMMSSSTANLPTLDFRIIGVEGEIPQIAVLDNKNTIKKGNKSFYENDYFIGMKHIPKSGHNSYHNISNTHNNNNNTEHVHNISYNNSNIITFGKKNTKADNLIKKFASQFKK